METAVRGGRAERRTSPRVHHSPGSHLVASQGDRGCGKGSCLGWVRTGAGLFGSLHPFPPESSSGQVSSQRPWIVDNQTQVLPENKPPQYLFGSQQPLRWYEMLSS